MDKKVYEVIFHIEDEYWWYVGLNHLVQFFIDNSAKIRTGLRLLDAGCGTGKILEMNARLSPVGVDFSDEALAFCRQRKLDRIVQASVCDLPFEDNSFDLLVSLDVLYHDGVKNDIQALQEFSRVLVLNGTLLLNLPAYNFLKSEHDAAIHTRQRYEINELKNKLKKAGLRIEQITYRNSFLFPVALSARIFKKIFSRGKSNRISDLKTLPQTINWLLTGILKIENTFVKAGFNFPFGLSIFCVAKKV